MKKLLGLLLTFVSPMLLWGQTVSVSADLKTMFGGATSSKVQVCFSLTDGNGNQISNPRTSSGVIVPTATQCVSPDGAGHISTTVIANDQITPSNSIYSVTYTFNGRVVHGDIFQFALADGTENLNTKLSLSTIPVVSTPTGDTTYARLDGGNSPFTGNEAFNGTVLVANTGIFTDTQMNQYDTANIHNLNFTSEFQLAEGSHAATDAIAGGIAVPVGSTVLQAEPIAGYATNSSTTTFAFGGYFQSRCTANSTRCGGINPVAFDTLGLTTGIILYGSDLLVTPRNAPSAYQTMIGMSVGLNATTAGSDMGGTGVDVNSQNTSFWHFGFQTRDQAALVALQAGALCTSGTCSSQPIGFSSYNGGVLKSGQWQMDQIGNIYAIPSGTAMVGGGGFTGIERTAPTGIPSQDIFFADSTAHRWKMINNNGSVDAVLGAATTDTVIGKTMQSPDGSCTTASFGFLNATNTGLAKESANNAFALCGNGTKTASLGSNYLQISSTASINASDSSDSNGSSHTGFSRVANGVWGAGNSTPGDVSGEFRSTRIAAIFNAGGTLQTSGHLVEDTCTLGTNCSVTLTGSAAFTSSSSYRCTASDTTAAAAVRVNQTSGSAVAFTGTGTDVINYTCIGN